MQSVHSFAPGAKILLVVCKSSNLNDLFAGVNYAKQHAGILFFSFSFLLLFIFSHSHPPLFLYLFYDKSDYISMSFGGPEGTYSASYDTTYLAGSTKSFFASTGDSGSAGKNKEYD